MSKNICHFCLEEKNDMAINGQYKTKGDKYIYYRLCNQCSKKLASINSRSDSKARQDFLTSVKNNAKKTIYK